MDGKIKPTCANNIRKNQLKFFADFGEQLKNLTTIGTALV
jgi:hypothetical protein